MSKKKAGENLRERLNMAGRQFSDSTIVFHEFVAQRAGLAGADHKYVSILLQQGSMTAGELADHTGLTTGAITGVIDRLEKAGFVRRDRDPNDRRKVIIVPDQQKAQKVFGPVFGRLIEKMTTLYDQYTPQELAIIHSYMEKTTVLIKELVQELGSKDGE